MERRLSEFILYKGMLYTRRMILAALIALVLFVVFGLPSLIESSLNEDRTQLEEMQVYHSDKGLVEITEDGYINIKKQ